MESAITPQNLNDLLDPKSVNAVLEDCDSLGKSAVLTFFTSGATKAPIKKFQLQKIVSYSSLIAHMQCVEMLMNFLENNEVIDGFDPQHDVVQSIYGELCIYLLKLDKMLLAEFQVVSNIDKSEIEKRTLDYVNKFEGRRRLIMQLQEQLKLSQGINNV